MVQNSGEPNTKRNRCGCILKKSKIFPKGYVYDKTCKKHTKIFKKLDKAIKKWLKEEIV